MATTSAPHRPEASHTAEDTEGAPQTLIQSCLAFGTFSYIIEKLNRQQPALALPSAAGLKDLKAGPSVLPPFTLNMPHDAMEGFSSFQNFLSKFRES
uniref:Uncharacterized protein n=1 Tax=Aegilops tauschii TaxID=37682 RepID=M8BNW2_AEGTA